MAQTICIKISADLFRDAHVRAAERGCSLQQYVTELVEKDLFPEAYSQKRDHQFKEILTAVQKTDDILCQIVNWVRDQGYTFSPDEIEGLGRYLPQHEDRQLLPSTPELGGMPFG